MLTLTLDNLRSKALGLLRQTSPGARVLLYHRVTDLTCDPQLLSVSPKRFDEQMQLIARSYQPISLRYLWACVRRGDVPHRAVVVTFDDGYEDNLTIAKPILERHGIPATVFVASGSVGGDRAFYWDKLEDIFLSDRMLPEELNITIGQEQYRWSFAGETDGYHNAGWSALSPTTTRRQAAYVSLCDKLRPLPYDRQQPLINELCQWASASPSARPTHRAMTAEQLRQLVDGGLIEVGAHTIDHPILAKLTDSEQRRQIRQCKDDLERIIDQPVQSFSYPYGTRSSYTLDTVAAVRDAGFDCACSNFPGKGRRGTDPFQLPRVLVRDWAGDRLLQEVGRAAA